MFWTMLADSIIVQSVVTTVLVVTSCVLYATGREVPEGLATLTYTVVAFWMGSKVQYAADRAARRASGGGVTDLRAPRG